MLGFKTVHYPTRKEFLNINKYDFMCDVPIQIRFKELDVRFPGSKFIYTIRNIEGWLKSQEYLWRIHAKNSEFHCPWNEEVRSFMHVEDLDYSKPFDLFKDRIKAAYLRHDDEVNKYFESRPDDLLIMDICNGEGWDKLIPFLGLKKIPSFPFPFTNKAENLR